VYEISVANLDGSGLRKLVQGGSAFAKAPSVSPRGDVVAYEAACTSGDGIWTTELAVTTESCKGTLVTPAFAAAAYHPTWGGTTLVAFHLVDPFVNVARLAVASRKRGVSPCMLSDGSNDDRNPDWYTP